MRYTLTKGTHCNYEITLIVPETDMPGYKASVLKNFQKDINVPGFRKGHVPLDMVEQKVSPEYITIGIFEEIVHQGTKQLLDEHKDIKFIGSIYDLNREEKENETHITFKLDIFPEVSVKNDNRKTNKLPAISTEPTDEEVAQTLLNLQKQYATYDPTDNIGENSIFKIKFSFLDKDGVEVDKGTAYLGQEDFEEFPYTKELFIGKKADETFDIAYDHDKLPHVMHCHKEGAVAARITGTINDVRNMILPELTEENIVKYFWNDNIRTREALEEELRRLIKNQKEEMQLMQHIDEYLKEVLPSFDVIIPKTLVEEEKKTRLKQLEERMWGESGLKGYYERIGDEKKNEMHKEIEQAAQTSLQKFFLLKTVAEQLDITDLDWNTPLAVERAVYAKLAK